MKIEKEYESTNEGKPETEEGNEEEDKKVGGKGRRKEEREDWQADEGG